jgi:hypothetical protein
MFTIGVQLTNGFHLINLYGMRMHLTQSTKLQITNIAITGPKELLMKQHKQISIIALILIAIVSIISLNPNAKAQHSIIQPTPQQAVVSYLEEQFRQQNIPIVQINFNPESAALEITLQSASEGDKFAPEDFISLHMPIHDVVLASEKGFHVENVTETLLNANGKRIFWQSVKIDADVMYIKLPPAQASDSVARDLIIKKINTYGMTIRDIAISSSEHFQTLNILLSTPLLEQANSALPQFISSLEPLVSGMNAQGAGIVLSKVELRNEEGEILLTYLLDMQLRTSGWWTADGINSESWFPSRPAPAPTP